MKETLVEYLRSYKPLYRLTEGLLEKKPGANRYATVHRLRQALATQLPEQRKMQGMEGHASVKTTEIYMHVTEKGGNQIQSPLDHLDPGDKRNRRNGATI
jgi:site-specific recombinase XerC